MHSGDGGGTLWEERAVQKRGGRGLCRTKGTIVKHVVKFVIQLGNNFNVIIFSIVTTILRKLGPSLDDNDT